MAPTVELAPIASMGMRGGLKLHPQWIRERCTCAVCVCCVSKQTNYGMDLSQKQPATRTQVKDAWVDANRTGDGWDVVFADDHVVALNAHRILAEIAAFDVLGAVQCSDTGRPKRTLWSNKDLTLPMFQYDTLQMTAGNPTELIANLKEAMNGSSTVTGCGHTAAGLAASCSSRAEVLDALLKYGIVVIQNVPCESCEVQRFTTSLVGHVRDTHWGAVFDVKVQTRAFADKSYSSEPIDLHCDSPYRIPAVDFQVLHCLLSAGCAADEGVNRFVDAVHCAEILRQTDVEAFELLCKVPLKWENDLPLARLQPTFELDATKKTVERVFISSKSGGYAPPLPPAELEEFYTAKRKFMSLLESPENVLRHSLLPGELVMFVNTRVLHARTSFDATRVSRHLQGVYLDYDAVLSSNARYRAAAHTYRDSTDDRAAQQEKQPLQTTGASPAGNGAAGREGGPDGVAPEEARPTWTSLAACTSAEISLMNRLYKADNEAYQVPRVLDMLRRQQGQHCELGAPIDMYTHGLQAATRAHRGGEKEDLVVMALLHDVGELLTPSNHGEVSAALLAPYVEPQVTWIAQHHEIFQMFYYGKQAGIDHNVREQFRDSPHFDACERFCFEYDQPAFDPNYESLPLSFFEPMVQRVFSRKPYWHTPTHPKASAVIGGPPEA